MFPLAIGAAILLCVSTSQAATFTAAAAGDWNLGATWGNPGNDVAGSGYPGAGDTATIGAGNTVTVNATTEACATLNINSTGVCLNNGTLTVGTALASPTTGGTLTQGGGATLNLNGTTTVTTLGAGAAGNTINYGGAAQTVKAVAYQNLGLSGSAAKTMTSVTTIGGNLAASGTCTATLAGATTVGGSLSVSGATITTANSTSPLTVTGTTTVASGTLKLGGQTANPTFSGDFTINGGTFDSNGGLPIFGGNFIYSSGVIQDLSGASARTWTFSGTGKTISGTFTIPAVVAVSGSVTNLGAVGITRNGSGVTLSGAGAWIQGANSSLTFNNGTAPTVTTLDCATYTPNTVVYNTTGLGTPSNPRAIAYNNLALTAGTTWALSGAGLSVANNLTLGSATAIPTVSWPANNSIGGSLIYSSSGASTFPANLSIGGLSQSAGTLTLSSGATLTVTGTGAGTWTRSAGTFTANAASTVKFTGAAPDIGNAVAMGFGKLLIDSTAANVTASGTTFTVATALTINSGGQLDIFALSGSSLTLGASASLTNSGTIKGSIVTGATGKVYAGTDGGYGTSTIALAPSTGDLTMTSGSTANLDVNSTAAAANDRLVVGGTLTVNNNVFNIKAPSAGAAIDTANDYALATAGSISGTPVLNWVTGFVPAGSSNYVLVVSGGTIKLHYNSVTSGSPTITTSVGGGNLTLSWDSTTFPGFSVQGQTNSAGIGTNWGDTGSGTTSPFVIAINPANPSVFFRLVHP
jgi:hypothetical protein